MFDLTSLSSEQLNWLRREVTKEDERRKQLQDFSKNLVKAIERELSFLGEPIFTIGGDTYTSLYSVSKVLRLEYSKKSWVRLCNYVMDNCEYRQTEGRYIETDDGLLYLKKTSSDWPTLCIRIEEVEDIITRANPRVGPKKIKEFKNRS